MFRVIRHVSDIRDEVAEKTEIRFLSQPYGLTVACYLFMDAATFDTPAALECRGITFDKTGAVVSRPLHKFFNIGEREETQPHKLLSRTDIAAGRSFTQEEARQRLNRWLPQ